jgi:hypothetical protein
MPMNKIILTFMILLALPSLVSASVSFSISGKTVPTTVEPGSSTNLIMTIANLGTTNAENVELVFSPNSYITPGQSSYSLQVIQAGSSIQVVVPLKISEIIPEGTNAVFFSVNYVESGSSGTKSIQNSVTISVTKRSLIEVSNVTYSKDFIQPGDTVVMKVELQNLGKGNVKDMVISLGNISSLFVPVGSDTDFYLGSLPPGSKGVASFSLVVNKDVNTLAYSIPITLTYYDESNTLIVEQKFVGIKISGKPDFVVSMEKETNMFSGSVGTMSITISNRGTSTAQFLTLKFDSSMYVTPSEYYVGNLNPDDSSTVSLDLNLAGVSAGKHSLNMTMSYKDPYNKDFSETRVVQFDVTNRPIQISTNMQIIIILIVIVIAYWKRNFLKKLIKRK